MEPLSYNMFKALVRNPNFYRLLTATIAPVINIMSLSPDRRLTDRLTDLDHTVTYCDIGRRKRAQWSNDRRKYGSFLYRINL